MILDACVTCMGMSLNEKICSVYFEGSQRLRCTILNLRILPECLYCFMLESYLASLLGLPSSVMLPYDIYLYQWDYNQLQNDRGIAKQYCVKYTFGNNEWLILESLYYDYLVHTGTFERKLKILQLKCNFIQNGRYEILSTWKDH